MGMSGFIKEIQKSGIQISARGGGSKDDRGQGVKQVMDPEILKIQKVTRRVGDLGVVEVSGCGV